MGSDSTAGAMQPACKMSAFCAFKPEFVVFIFLHQRKGEREIVVVQKAAGVLKCILNPT